MQNHARKPQSLRGKCGCGEMLKKLYQWHVKERKELNKSVGTVLHISNG